MSDVQTVEVKLDPSMHKRQPESAGELVSWPVLDTAYKLLQETAVKLVFVEMRRQAAEQGVDFPATDEGVFELALSRALPGEEVPTCYADLAPDSEDAGRALYQALRELTLIALIEAKEGAARL